MHCNGKCHLKKALIAQEKNENNTTSPTKEKQETIQFFQIKTVLKIFDSSISSNYNSFFHIVKTQSVLFQVFHPPTV